MSAAAELAGDDRLARFETFNALGGKFRVAVTGVCNLRCFFCHNEAMGPMGARIDEVLSPSDLVAICDAYAALGGKQINITGGEPMARPDLPELLQAIDKRATRLVLNSNGLLHERLTSIPRVTAVDTILVSLHTLDDAVFRRDLGGKSTDKLTQSILALRAHGYQVKLNLSLGPHNAAGIEPVVRWAHGHGLDLKIISLVRPNSEPDFYHGSWVDPARLEALLDSLGTRGDTREQLGGRITEWRAERSTLELKNIARGRLRTDFCAGCAHERQCGEGIYGLRLGIDGVAKPCLLRRERFSRLDGSRSWREQILDLVASMVGDFHNARFETGAPE
ncbi:MAG: radical SAM protein [Deltaproteobacteria bacterium]|nr:radical SAM protein [Deltaproteobacteria bacterium]